MLKSCKELIKYKIAAEDGQIGSVKDVLFDDRVWTVQYLEVDTGGWLTGRRVVLPEKLLGPPDWSNRSIPVELTRSEVEQAPPIEEREPISRRHETGLLQYFRLDPYWIRVRGAAENQEQPRVRSERAGKPRVRGSSLRLLRPSEILDGAERMMPVVSNQFPYDLYPLWAMETRKRPPKPTKEPPKPPPEKPPPKPTDDPPKPPPEIPPRRPPGEPPDKKPKTPPDEPPRKPGKPPKA